MKVAVHYEAGSRRSEHIARRMAKGIAQVGDVAELCQGFDQGVREGVDACVAYGWGAPHLFEAYRAAGKSFVYIDLGWWNRKPHLDMLGGHHKVIVNCREPSDTASYLRRPVSRERFARSGITIKPWRERGFHILVAGMSAKCAETYGLEPEQWERAAIEAITRVRWTAEMTKPPTFYRPKPSWAGWTRLPGAMLSPPDEPIEQALASCWAVVTHHSNVAVDALIAGVPVCVDMGVCTPLATPLARLWNPVKMNMRLDLLRDLAWLQWTPDEMAQGLCWAALKETTDLCVR